MARDATTDEGVREYHEVLTDGLLDIFIGMLVLVLVAYAGVGQSAAPGTRLAGQTLVVLSVVVLAAGNEFLRRRVTYKRIGRPMETGDLERRQAVVMLVLLMSLLVGAGIPFVLARVPRLAETYFVATRQPGAQ